MAMVKEGMATGYHRLGEGYADVLTPEAVLAQLGLGPRTVNAVDGTVSDALNDLDRLSADQLSSDQLRARLHPDNFHLAVATPALDQARLGSMAARPTPEF